MISIFVHFEVFLHVIPGNFFSKNWYPFFAFWCFLQVTARQFLKNWYPFWHILRYFNTPPLEKCKKICIHFGAFRGIFTHHSWTFFEKSISILVHFDVFSQVTARTFLKNWYPFWHFLRYFHTLQMENKKNWYPFFCILRYFHTSSLDIFCKNLYPFSCILMFFYKLLPDNFWKIDIHFATFWGTLTHHH